MDYASFERAALARGPLVRARLDLRSTIEIVTDTRVDQPLAQPSVVQPILQALDAMGGVGNVAWKVERLNDGTKRIHAVQRKAPAQEKHGWDAVVAA